jgi:hypothetical protein
MATRIAGVVRRDGSIIRKVEGDFEVTTAAGEPGRFVIRFIPPFNGIPSVVASHVWSVGDTSSGGGAVQDTATVVGMTHERAKIATGDNNGQHTPREFAFIAVG